MKPYAREPRKYSSQGSGPGDMKKDLKRPEWSMKIIEGQQLVFSELTIFNFNGGEKMSFTWQVRPWLVFILVKLHQSNTFSNLMK